ncbi:MAG: hypothetical protein DHS20C02_11140 [Micavibrio sp.]|nr:MAG: hypothetical protein DHS20C02_11140 [Micavibrio sp.]
MSLTAEIQSVIDNKITEIQANVDTCAALTEKWKEALLRDALPDNPPEELIVEITARQQDPNINQKLVHKTLGLVEIMSNERSPTYKSFADKVSIRREDIGCHDPSSRFFEHFVHQDANNMVNVVLLPVSIDEKGKAAVTSKVDKDWTVSLLIDGPKTLDSSLSNSFAEGKPVEPFVHQFAPINIGKHEMRLIICSQQGDCLNFKKEFPVDRLPTLECQP